MVCTDSAHVNAAFTASGRTYGSRRVRAALCSQGVTMGRHRVRSLMRANGLRPVWRRKFVHTTDSKHNMPISNNVLARQFDRPLPKMPAALVCAALQMAIVQRNPDAGLIVHSDRGTQYASAEHQTLLKKHGLVGSMSRKGNCWDNAVMERFFLNLKMERVWQKDYANHSEAMTDVADYIVGFYNCLRLHSTLGNLSPNAFERESAKQQSIDVSEKT